MTRTEATLILAVAIGIARIDKLHPPNRNPHRVVEAIRIVFDEPEKLGITALPDAKTPQASYLISELERMIEYYRVNNPWETTF